MLAAAGGASLTVVKKRICGMSGARFSTKAKDSKRHVGERMVAMSGDRVLSDKRCSRPHIAGNLVIRRKGSR